MLNANANEQQNSNLLKTMESPVEIYRGIHCIQISKEKMNSYYKTKRFKDLLIFSS